MTTAPSVTFNLLPAGQALCFAGEWRGAAIPDAISSLGSVMTSLKPAAETPSIRIGLRDVTGMDTFGAVAVVGVLRDLTTAGYGISIVGGAPEILDLLGTITKTRFSANRPASPPWMNPLEAIGRSVAGGLSGMLGLLEIQGRLVAAIGAILTMRSPLRLTSIVHQLDHAGFRAIPIVALISFVVGIILTQQSILQLQNFGATIFVVDLAAVLMLREAGVLLAAIMLAGRSGSAITAEIGSMRMREEVDALKVMGLDPFRILLLPRVLALVLALPMLGFIGSLAGLAGAAVIARIVGDIPLDLFADRLQAAVSMQSVLVGLVKAPFMAFVVGLIACSEGLKVGGSAESLGQHTTTSVVKSIFAVIVADGLFAVFFAAVGI